MQQTKALTISVSAFITIKTIYPKSSVSVAGEKEKTMNYTSDELQKLWRESKQRERNLIQEYKKTHSLPSRGIILTPEIQKEKAEQKRLYAETPKLKQSL